jgi:hypothetical protein
MDSTASGTAFARADPSDWILLHQVVDGFAGWLVEGVDGGVPLWWEES